MKTSALVSSVFIAASTLLSVLSTTSAHMAISNPPAQAGPWTKDLKSDVHAWIGYEGKKFPCGGYKKGPVTTYRAGQIIPVRFWTFGVDYKKFPPKAGLKPSRHGGGACEFSLSYDGGKSWKVIGQYTKTCPDIYYEWPVLIPKNAPSCKDSNKCLFAFSWTAYATNQFYHHCANVIINGVKGGKLPTLEMTVVDVKQLKQKQNTHAKGDARGGRSSGPDRREKQMSTNGYYAAGGGAGNHGIDLGLVRR
ncbi:hypothetical protein EMPS_03165 [Entomortierella parvispora]|uniref:Lytic polysaccharide monooxygenase n=1 Tax=Entomortierella parvispora TaxID=205924 RepID=A0A9P3H634_9FUNG|nr:hypothetical protein EMPS_03165 [Entomortierella parvispora]